MKSEIAVTIVEINGTKHLSVQPLGYVDDLSKRLYRLGYFTFDVDLRRWLARFDEDLEAALHQEFTGDRHVVSESVVRQDDPPRRQFTPAGAKSVPLSPHWADALRLTEEQLRVKRYSWRTVKSYLSHLRMFFIDHNGLQVDEITEPVIRRYILRRTKSGSYSASTQNQLLNAIKFWFEHVEDHPKTFVDLRPRKPSDLPTVLSVEEVRRLFQAVDNIKHRCILKMIYGGGLRLSEATNLRIADVLSDRMQLFIHGGKGKKDRYTILSQNALDELRVYFQHYRPSYWLFEGQSGGQYSVRSVQSLFRRAVQKSRVNPYATVHTLRHSYATHLLEQGVSLRHIQELLGHESSRTTERYTRVSNDEKRRIISPLDRLDTDEE